MPTPGSRRVLPQRKPGLLRESEQRPDVDTVGQQFLHPRDGLGVAGPARAKDVLDAVDRCPGVGLHEQHGDVLLFGPPQDGTGRFEAAGQ